MKLPEGFHFTQTIFQDFVDCKRLFLLRYILGISWPAVQAEPVQENERRLVLGEQFHHMVHQYLLGIPENRLEVMIQDEELKGWWDNFLSYKSILLGDNQNEVRHFPEIILSTQMGQYRLVGKYDLIIIKPDHLTIIDWKTSWRKPKRGWLKERLQTHVYPYLFCKSGAQLAPDISIRPEQCEMVYWFSKFPHQPEHFSYSETDYVNDQIYLTGLVEKIEGYREDDFVKTQHTERCGFCVYRSLCDRGLKARILGEGEIDLETDDIDVNFDFEQIAEIEF